MRESNKTNNFPKDIFHLGMDFSNFINRFPKNRDYFLKRYNKDILANFNRQKSAAKALIEKLRNGPKRKLLVITVDWCPDSYNTLGFFVRLCEYLNWEISIFEKETPPRIIQHFKKNGTKEAVPVYAFYDEDFNLLFWVSDRHESGEEWKNRWLGGKNFDSLSKNERKQFLVDLNEYYDKSLFEITAMDILTRLSSYQSGSKSHQFPNDFLWGTSTASYQIEGYPLEDGATPSIWHEFSHKKGKIKNNENGDIACDHYHRYREDIENLKKLGVNAYRFSVAWSRIIPEPGKVNQKGLDFYKKIIDSLLAANIRPFITLFHWDTPLWLEKLGGFRERVATEHFSFYAETLFKSFGELVKDWISINEPMVYTINGYVMGNMAPGYKRDLKGMFHATHYLLLSHERAYRLLHEINPKARIGIAEAQLWIKPLRDLSSRDLKAATLMDNLVNRMYIDPITVGGYPASILKKAGRFFPKGFEKDFDSMKDTSDFIGINYYMSKSFKYSLFTPLIHAREVPTPGARKSAMWEIYPEGLYKLLVRIKEDYGNIQTYVTENGYPLPEGKMKDPLDDEERIQYLQEHISMVKRAIDNGVNVKGYFLWSLMDNFEWDLGYDMRFGLIRVDFKNLTRKWKKSAYWYRDVIKKNAVQEDNSRA